MRVQFQILQKEFKRILLAHAFSETKAELCARIFAENSRDGVHSHGLNRFPNFINSVKEEHVDPHAEPQKMDGTHSIEYWDGNLGPGMYNATLCMARAMEIADINGIGCVTLKNTNHWMRGGTYGWQAADAGYIGICFTNTIANLTPWGGMEPRLGNNPLVIAVPRKDGNIVLDMAMSQYSFGKLQEYKLRNEKTPFASGYDYEGNLSTDPEKVIQTHRSLPIGYWKGSGLSLMIDVLLTALTGGKSTAEITKNTIECGVSQCFICIKQANLHEGLTEEIIRFAKTSALPGSTDHVFYPGENTLLKRKENLLKGIPVNDQIWQRVLEM